MFGYTVVTTLGVDTASVEIISTQRSTTTLSEAGKSPDENRMPSLHSIVKSALSTLFLHSSMRPCASHHQAEVARPDPCLGHNRFASCARALALQACSSLTKFCPMFEASSVRKLTIGFQSKELAPGTNLFSLAAFNVNP